MRFSLHLGDYLRHFLYQGASRATSCLSSFSLRVTNIISPISPKFILGIRSISWFLSPISIWVSARISHLNFSKVGFVWRNSMVSFVGSVMSPAVNICKSSSGPSSSSSSSYMKTFSPNSDLGKPFLVRSLTNRKDKWTVCACVAPPRDYKTADSDRFPNTRFNHESAKSENVSLLREPEDESDVLIECRNVCKSFGDKHILRGVSLKIRHGEAVGIIGPSGTGKSTILKIMAGLLAPDKGEVLIRGKLRNGLVSDEEISGLRIGLVFQSAALFDSLTVRENVGFLLYENSAMPEDQIAQLVTETLAAVGLKEVEDRLPSELSGGMKKRVALARSIIFDTTKDIVEPEVLLYDEPTAGLDPIASTVVEDLIRSVHAAGEDALGKPGKIASYVVVTHQHSTIKRAVDRLIFLYEGKVVWQGMTHEFSTSANPIVRQFASGSLDGPIRY
ncbi:protein TRIGALACTOSYLDIACYLGLYCEROL 3, chloroplastic isoform X1 [Solanum dulcamara]|uniref:protein TRIGALACTOSYLDIACYLGLYCEROL 3, chloroplastic isoform X1 n=1 Tax=Solanum dulcamara TaxID=45834 RepID=UPI002485992E|nr:protein TRIGALACTOSYLDIACYLGLYCEROL 3, chloroplastic isoform X1 [Solanum dulcamara]